MHIPELLVKASESFELAEADTLLTRIRQWTARIENVLDEVERQRDYPLFLKGVGSLRPFLELLGELSKELQRQPEINVTISEGVQNSIINALSEYPEARSRVIHALEAATGEGDG
jgi:hypothetical protein